MAGVEIDGDIAASFGSKHDETHPVKLTTSTGEFLVSFANILSGEIILEGLRITSEDKVKVLYEELDKAGWQVSFLISPGGDTMPHASLVSDCGIEEGCVISVALGTDSFAQHEESSLLVTDSKNVEKVNDNPDFGTAIGSKICSSGVHTWRLVRTGQAQERNSFIGICNAVVGFDRGPHGGLENFVCFSDFQGDLRREFLPRNMKILMSNLSTLSNIGDELEIVLDCDARTVTFSAPGQEESLLGSIDELPALDWRLFVTLDNCGEAWELR